MMPTVEDATRCAEIRAAIDLGEEKAAVLRAHGTSVDAWAALEQSVIEAIADQIDRGEVELVQAFQRAYDANVGTRPEPPQNLVEPAIRAPRIEPTPIAFHPAPPVATPLPVGPRAAPPIHIATASAVPPNAHTVAPNRDVLEALLDRGALPFAGEARPPVAKSAQPVVQSGATVAPNANVLQSLLAGGALPFGGEARAPSGPSNLRPADIASRSTAAPTADAGKAPALPFGAPKPQSDAGLMPLDRYAEITATLEKEGNPMKTFERIGATPESWMALVLTYSKLFANDRALEAQFEALMRRHRGK